VFILSVLLLWASASLRGRLINWWRSIKINGPVAVGVVKDGKIACTGLRVKSVDTGEKVDG
jgi:hypothetical protein